MESLGPGADNNEIMSRLNKGAPLAPPGNRLYQSPPMGVDSMGTVGHVVGHMTGSEHHQRSVVDPAKLRHIVIDGSNVAMR